MLLTIFSNHIRYHIRSLGHHCQEESPTREFDENVLLCEEQSSHSEHYIKANDHYNISQSAMPANTNTLHQKSTCILLQYTIPSERTLKNSSICVSYISSNSTLCPLLRIIQLKQFHSFFTHHCLSIPLTCGRLKSTRLLLRHS